LGINIEAIGSFLAGRLTIEGRRSGSFSSLGDSAPDLKRSAAVFVSSYLEDEAALLTTGRPLITSTWTGGKLLEDDGKLICGVGGAFGGVRWGNVVAGTEVTEVRLRLTVLTVTRSAKLGEGGGRTLALDCTEAQTGGLGRAPTG
jgi:hypothetical protein